jgi:hypothetical protein
LWCDLCFLRILYLHCWKKKINKTKENKRKTQVRERDAERERDKEIFRERGPDLKLTGVFGAGRSSKRERERERDVERESNKYRER